MKVIILTRGGLTGVYEYDITKIKVDNTTSDDGVNCKKSAEVIVLRMFIFRKD